MSQMRLVIFGSRNAHPSIDDITEALLQQLELRPDDISEVICGGARGAGECGRVWAAFHDVPVKLFEADWDKYGRRAGFVRNKQMAEYTDVGLGFWCKESSGTANMAAHLLSQNKVVVLCEW